MSVVAPPTCDTAIFNPSCWITETVGTVVGGYLEYPQAQGSITLKGATHSGLAVFQDGAEFLNSLFDGQGFAGADGYVMTSAGGGNVWSPSTADGFPVGVVVPHTSGVLPIGWLWCDGSTYATADYPVLYAIMGDAYNTTAGAGYFQVPNFTGNIAFGSSSTSVMGKTLDVGTSVYGGNTQMLSNQMVPHYHPMTFNNANAKICDASNTTSNTTVNNTGQNRGVSTNSTNLPAGVQPPPPYSNNTFQNTAYKYPTFSAFNWIIKS